MDREKLQLFIKTSEDHLASVRRSLLIVAQTSDTADLVTARRNLVRLNIEAAENDLPDIAHLAADCEAALNELETADTVSPNAVYAALDQVARIEAAVFGVPMHSDDFLPDIAGFVDDSFNEFAPVRDKPAEPEWADEGFEIDEETLDIFRSEAEELLANIAGGLRVLAAAPGDQNALWEIRRNAHTFKGAAGIVGFKDACRIAHRMEDLLDRLVEMRCEAAPQVVDFLNVSAGRLNDIVAAKGIGEDESAPDTSYEHVMSSLISAVEPHDVAPKTVTAEPDAAAAGRTDAVKTTTTPVVRVSLDRLDELIRLSRGLLINRSALAESITGFRDNGGDTFTRLESIFEVQRCLTDELHAKLLRIRMVKFGTLETRLSRAVHATCLDENKKAVVEIENGEVEIDTQIIDALIEPLLHLLKNAVVHGIEPPETRRLIGKPERGNIRVRLETDEIALVLSVADDGGGISLPKLIEKAVANGVITDVEAAGIDDSDAVKLIFDRGLTTADKIDLNAGRGVGMSIVKESVESKGGSVLVETEPQRGTKFTILMPFGIAKSVPAPEPTVLNKPESPLTLPPLVMIVDDSASIRRRTAKVVEQAGFRIITAPDGAEALELLLSGVWQPDLILSDVEMPQLDGWALLEYVKTDENLGHIPVVMVTSLDGEEHRKRAFELGASDYLVKPFTGNDIEGILKKLGSPVGA